MSKKLRRFLIALAALISGVFIGLHFGVNASSAALADRDLRLRNLHALWNVMCIMDPDHMTDNDAACNEAWEAAQRGPQHRSSP